MWVRDPQPTWEFDNADYVGETDVVTGSQHEFGYSGSLATGNAGTAEAGIETHWSFTGGEVDNPGPLKDAITTNWTAPNIAGEYMLTLRAVREGLLITRTWRVRVSAAAFAIQVYCPRIAEGGSMVEVSADALVTGFGAVVPRWHLGSVETYDAVADNAFDDAAFADPEVLSTILMVPDRVGTAAHDGFVFDSDGFLVQIVISMVVVLAGMPRGATCVVRIIADLPAGSGDVSDFVNATPVPIQSGTS